MVNFLTKRWVQIFLLLMLLAGLLWLREADPPMVKSMRNMVFDHYNRKFPRKPGDQTVIIDIDEESLQRYGQWPWPRSLVGDIPVILKEMGAKSVAFDMVFAEPDRTSPEAFAKSLPDTEELAKAREALARLPQNDEIFAGKIEKAGNVVLGFVSSNKPTGRNPVKKAAVGILKKGTKTQAQRYMKAAFQDFASPLEVLADAAAGSGYFGAQPDDDGIIRHESLLVGGVRKGQLTEDFYPLLALEAVRVALGAQSYRVEIDGLLGCYRMTVGAREIPMDGDCGIYVYYAGHRPSLYIPAWKILEREIDPALVGGKIAFVGTSAIGLKDLRSTPLDNVLPGVEVHAEIAEQILNLQFLRRVEATEWGEKVLIGVIGLFVIFLAPFIGTATLAGLAVLLGAAGYAGGLYIYQNYGELFDPLYPMFSIVFIFVASAILTHLRMEREKREIRLAFGQYIAPAVLEELTADPSKLKLGGEVRELSVMFTDIRNFTTISESMDPGDLIRMMNDFLTPMTSAVLDNRGTVDKYMGDAMMAFWNAPVDDPNHAVNACKAALEMVEAMKPVNDDLKLRAESAGRPFYELKAGIGINSGRASVGNMGSRQRFAYSALGDTVNLASRLEGQTKGYGISVMISESTREQAQDFAAIEIDLLTVKGRAEPERVFALLGTPEDARGEDFRRFAESHARMLEAYRAMAWEKAMEQAKALAEARPALGSLYGLYQSRIAEYMKNPPPAGWDGVWIAMSK